VPWKARGKLRRHSPRRRPPATAWLKRHAETSRLHRLRWLRLSASSEPLLAASPDRSTCGAAGLAWIPGFWCRRHGWVSTSPFPGPSRTTWPARGSGSTASSRSTKRRPCSTTRTGPRSGSSDTSDGTLSNPLTGKSINDSGDFKVTVDLVTGERTIDGNLSTATISGGGAIYHAVGRLAFEPDGSVFEAGPHDDADNNLGALCGYLASP
jgi:hypothetical protein